MAARMLTAVPDVPRIGGLVGRVRRDRNHPAPEGKPLLFSDGAAFGQCPICLDESDETVVVFTCGHSVCGACNGRMDDGSPLRKCAICRRETPREMGPVAYPLAPALRSGHAAFMHKMELFKGLAPRRIAGHRRAALDPTMAKFGVAGGDSCGFATLLSIPAAPADSATRATLYIFDRSGSMHKDFPDMIATMQGVLESSIGSYVAVIVFGSTADTAVPPHRVTADNIAATMAALWAIEVGGQTQLHLALGLAETVAHDMRERIAADGETAVVLALLVTDGEASAPGLAAEALGNASMAIFLAGYGTNYSYQECHKLFASSLRSAADFAHAATVTELASLLGEYRTLSSVRITCPPGSVVYCNGKAAPVDGNFETTYDRRQGVRFAVESPTVLDFSSLVVDSCEAPVAQCAELSLEVTNFVRAMFTLQYVMDLGSKLPDHDTHTLRSLLSRVSKVVRELPGMVEIAVVVAAQMERTECLDGRPDDGSNFAGSVAGQAARTLSCA